MQLAALIISTGLAVSLAPTGALAWREVDGKQVAENRWHHDIADYERIHESCLIDVDAGSTGSLVGFSAVAFSTSAACKYLKDDGDDLEHGYCKERDNEIGCERGCPDPFSPCQLDREDGTCSMGYAACLEKAVCTNEPGGADCIGESTGCLVCS